MRNRLKCLSFLSLVALAAPAIGATIYNNLTPNNLMAIATRPSSPGIFEIEAGDDFLLNGQTTISGASFVGLLVPGTGGTPVASDVVVEIYRVFPKDSDSVRTPNVPTRTNSPSDVEFDSRDSAASSLTFSTAVCPPRLPCLTACSRAEFTRLPSKPRAVTDR
jgi:hypothetical protein